MTSIIKKVTEMAKSAVNCPNCGKPIVGNHYYYKGQRKCSGKTKDTSVMQDVKTDIKQGAAPAPAPAAPMAAQPATKAAPAPAAQVENWLKEHKVEGYQIRQDGKVDVPDSDVRLDGIKVPTLPVQFGKIGTGNFIIVGGFLTSCQGCPEEVADDFLLNHNRITELAGSPQKVGGTCSYASNPFTKLDGICPWIGESLRLDDCPNLKSLQNIHKFIKHVGRDINLSETKIESNMLGLLLIDGLTDIRFPHNSKVQDIINKHLKDERDPIKCQDELIDAGFVAYAKF